MADNVAVTPGAGASIATDDVGGVQFQKVKLDLGGDGVSSPVIDKMPVQLMSLNFPASTGNNSTVQLASGASFTGAIETVQGEQAAQVQVTCDQAYTVVVRQYIDSGGTRLSGTYTFTRSAGVPLNENITLPGNYFNVTVTNNGGSTTTTFRIDTTFGIMSTMPYSLTDLGNLRGAFNEINGTAVSVNQGAADAGTQRVALNNEQVRDLFITGQNGQSAAGNNVFLATAGTTSTDTVSASGLVSYRSFYCQIIGSAGISSGQVTFEGSNDNTTFVALTVYDDAVITGTALQAAITIAASTNRFFSGKTTYRYVRCRISTVFAGGTIGAVTRFSLSDYVPRITTVGNPTAANLLANVTTCSTVTTLSNGQAAHAASIAGSPHRIAGRALNANYATLTTGQVADLVTTLVGALVMKPYAIPEQEFVTHDRITNSTTAAQLRALTASNKAYVTGITINTATLGGTTEFQLRSTPVASTTATIASNTLVMAATYNWKVGDMVFVTASGVTGLTVNTAYYILTVSGANLTFSATRGGATLAISGTSVSATLSKILWRTSLNSTAQPIVALEWNNPADTGTGLALEAVTTTAVTGQIDFSVSGYVAP
jgi:hypothetical protein